jgi:imidazolonepropionase-like amidohydrolase
MLIDRPAVGAGAVEGDLGIVCWLIATSIAAEPLAIAAEPLVDLDARGLARVEPVAAPVGGKVVIRGGTVMTATGVVHAPGYVVLDQGRIAAVGAGEPPSTDGTVVDAKGRYVTPGLIDTHSHLGVYASPSADAHSDGNEMTDPVTPGVWAEHSIDPQDPGFQRAIAGGVTSMQILPGSGNLIGGRGVVVHVVPARGGRGMRLEGAPETLKMACGENPKRVYGEQHRAPSTRMGNLRAQREAFLAAEQYEQTWAEHARKQAEHAERSAAYEAWEATGSKKGEPEEAGDPPLAPARDLDMETLVGVLQGRVLPEIHCYTASDMLSMLQVADEFGFKVRSFHHALEAYKIRDVLASREVAVSTWADWWGFKVEAFDGIPENLALVAEAGGRAVVHSDSEIGIQRLNQEASKGLASGRAAGIALTEDDALKWVTANPAWAIGVLDQVGTLEVGKRGDVVVWSGSPFSVYTEAELVYVDGVLRWDDASPSAWSDHELGREVTP